jgi:hypothetical protein
VHYIGSCSQLEPVHTLQHSRTLPCSVRLKTGVLLLLVCARAINHCVCHSTAAAATAAAATAAVKASSHQRADVCVVLRRDHKWKKKKYTLMLESSPVLHVRCSFLSLIHMQQPVQCICCCIPQPYTTSHESIHHCCIPTAPNRS